MPEGSVQSCEQCSSKGQIRLNCAELCSQAALEALRALPFGPGEDTVIVCNDWHTALLPVLLKASLHAPFSSEPSEYQQLLVARLCRNPPLGEQPFYSLQEVYQPRGEFLNTKVAFPIHNIAFQARHNLADERCTVASGFHMAHL